MSKYKTTEKEVLANEYIIISFGYCDIQRIERYLAPVLYTSGRYGWACDGYRLKNGWLLTTGYSPIEKTTFYEETNEDFKRLNKERLEEVAKLKADIKDLEKRIDTLDHEEARKEVSKYFIIY